MNLSHWISLAALPAVGMFPPVPVLAVEVVNRLTFMGERKIYMTIMELTSKAKRGVSPSHYLISWYILAVSSQRIALWIPNLGGSALVMSVNCSELA
jgi:hypothetical protein